MKVVLIKDVARLGRRHEIKDVPDGLAQNYLIPRKLVLPASPENIKKAQSMTVRRLTQQSEDVEAFKRMVEQLESSGEIVMQMPASSQGSLFKSVRADDIAKLISQQVGAVVTPAQVQLLQPIKSAGKHRIDLAHDGFSGQVTVNILPV